jgi:1-deoxy-D-xylulose-5-phosphate reductoisomerase
MKKVVILGSTGSIGTQCLDVIAQWPDRFRVLGLATHRNASLLIEQAARFSPEHVALMDPGAAQAAEPLRQRGIQVHRGLEGLMALATLPQADTVVVATVGAIGLRPTLAAIAQGKAIALANKEVLVMAGELVMREAQRRGAPLLPIDSEHSAIMQCLVGGQKNEIRRIIVTASGGPFRKKSADAMREITVKQALAHPTWSMGPKITIDSATLMNKGLEVIECYHLFGVPLEQIEVVVHPQSIVHSMVEFVDGSVIAQLASTDMRVPIQYALSYPERLSTHTGYLDLTRIGQLTFEPPDPGRFPCLGLAYEALRLGGTAPAVLSVANELAVEAFLAERIGFMDIPRCIERALQERSPVQDPDIDAILECEAETRARLKGRLL